MPAGKRFAFLQREHPWHIALLSANILILELAFIRIVPAEVREISYFTNLMLMAAFFGLGLGCILQQRRSLAWFMPVGLVLAFLFILVGRGIVIYESAREVHYWMNEAVKGEAFQLPLFQAAAAVFVFASLPFIALGQSLARTMDRYPRLTAYGWDIAGSLAGTVLFVLSSLLSVPPWIWPPLVALSWAVVFLRSRWRKVVFPLAGMLFLFFAHSEYSARWSPYYYVQYALKPHGIQVWVNSSFHQHGIDFSYNDRIYRTLQSTMLQKWNRPYEWFRSHNKGRSPKRVLVLGAGTGNDVSVALFNRAEEVVAVEIDPVILSLGKEHNGTRPYDDGRVTTRVDDARHYLRTAEPGFDMIVFGTLDSQALLSSQSNIRLENYVYTRESLVDARRLLNDGGMVVVYYSVFKDWLYNRIYSTIRSVFGDHSRIFLEGDNYLFNTLLVGAKGIDGFKDAPEVVEKYGRGLPSTDDWPFIYMERPMIAPVYIKLFAVVIGLIVGAFFLLRKLHPVTGLHGNYLFLGLGFTLMESSAIVRMALLFGSTWTVNAVVFSAVLLTIFIANRMVQKKKAPPISFAWIGLALFVVINYLVPVSLLLEADTLVRVLACGVLIGVPVFFAAVCFSTLFEKEPVTGYPLGINLIGAMAGGVIEYASMAVGMRNVWVIILAVYLLAWAATVLARRGVPGGVPGLEQ